MSNDKKLDKETEWQDKAMACYEKEKSQNPDYLTFDDVTIKAFARRIVEQIKEQMKSITSNAKLLLNAVFKNN